LGRLDVNVLECCRRIAVTRFAAGLRGDLGCQSLLSSEGADRSLASVMRRLSPLNPCLWSKVKVEVSHCICLATNDSLHRRKSQCLVRRADNQDSRRCEVGGRYDRSNLGIGRGWELWLDRACQFYKNCAFSRICPMDRVMRCANGGYLKSCERTGNLAFGRSVIDGAIIRPFERGYLRPLITNVRVTAGFSDVQRKGLVGSVLQIQIHT